MAGSSEPAFYLGAKKGAIAQSPIYFLVILRQPLICFPKFRFSDQRKTPQCKTGPCPNKKMGNPDWNCPLFVLIMRFFLACTDFCIK